VILSFEYGIVLFVIIGMPFDFSFCYSVHLVYSEIYQFQSIADSNNDLVIIVADPKAYCRSENIDIPLNLILVKKTTKE
jgi:hypothetical protein